MSDQEPEQTMPANVHGAVELGSPQASSTAEKGTTTTQLSGPIIRDVNEAEINEIVAISQQVPVIVDLWATWCQPCKQLGPILEQLTRELDGRIVLAKVDVDANPQLAQAFQAQSIPTVVALVAGRPLPLFQGAQPREQVVAILNDLLQAAAHNGVSGRMVPAETTNEPQVDPLHEAALAAEDAGDIDSAIAEWEIVLKKQPRDHAAKEALARLNLAKRVTSEEEDTSVLGRADQAFINDRVDEAFEILLSAMADQNIDADKRDSIRARLVEMFTVLGNSDSRVREARSRLSTLLF
ncbi:MAG: tetratricopeptide repeat protein [Actinomycetaceae bacterium]|nr:tetratricopeptide repeat protein [Actinomycetaceae bacterium]